MFHDEKGASINLGIYYPKETTSDKEIAIRMGQLVDILEVVDPTIDLDNIPEFENYKLAYDFLCQSIAKNCSNTRANVFVAYGTNKRPSRFLEFRAYNIIEPTNTSDEKTRLLPVRHEDPKKAIYNDLMSRIEPTEDGDVVIDEGWNEEKSSENAAKSSDNWDYEQ